MPKPIGALSSLAARPIIQRLLSSTTLFESKIARSPAKLSSSLSKQLLALKSRPYCLLWPISCLLRLSQSVLQWVANTEQRCSEGFEASVTSFICSSSATVRLSASAASLQAVARVARVTLAHQPDHLLLKMAPSPFQRRGEVSVEVRAISIAPRPSSSQQRSAPVSHL